MSKKKIWDKLKHSPKFNQGVESFRDKWKIPGDMNEKKIEKWWLDNHQVSLNKIDGYNKYFELKDRPKENNKINSQIKKIKREKKKTFIKLMLEKMRQDSKKRQEYISDIRKIRKLAGVPEGWDEAVERYLLFGEKAIPKEKLTIKFEKDNRTNNWEMWLRIEGDTRQALLTDNWTHFIKKFQKMLPFYISQYRTCIYLERDKRIWELYKKGLSKKEIKEKIDKEGWGIIRRDVIQGNQGGEIVKYDYIKDIIQRFKKRFIE